MNINKLVENLLPSFVLHYFLPKTKVIKLGKIQFIKDSDEIIVLGNGPSLKKDLERLPLTKRRFDFFCVNNFCSSPYFETLKPNKYIFLDAYFFSKNAHPDWVKQREDTFKTLNLKTKWKMQIFLPLNADDSILTNCIKNNNIEIIKMKVRGKNFKNPKIAVKKYLTGLYGPTQCNVLIYAIYLSIWSNYKKIRVIGADLNFHNDVEVNQQNNHLEITFKHFNQENHTERLMKNPSKIKPFSMAELMQTTSDTFRAHELIQEFADEKNIDIVNSSSFSMIDAYRRETL